jgi:hypothetical protein
MAIKDDKLVVKINSEEKDEIIETADRLDIPVSQFIREAAREKIAAIKDAANQEPATTGATA